MSQTGQNGMGYADLDRNMRHITDNGTLGGGEILQHIGQNDRKGTQFIDWDLVQQYASIPLVKALIIILLLVLFTLIVMRLFNIKSVFKGKGIKSEIGNVNNLKSRDRYIVLSNKWLKRITNLVQKTPFNMPANRKEYMQYNLKRANVKVPGGYRYMAAEEFNALVKLGGAVVIAIGLLAILLVNVLLGVTLICVAIICSSVLPMMILRSVVKERDMEIKENFSDFYLMLHYVLIIGGSTPIDKLMKSYAKTTDSEEMLRFVDNCVGHIDTHGEYHATTLIIRDYREIPEVGKLMRLIRQLHDGADVNEELLGFREELINQKKFMIEKRMNWLVKKAQASFNILMIILVQAILSAMALYLPDITQIGTFM